MQSYWTGDIHLDWWETIAVQGGIFVILCFMPL